jgi:predicted permease
LSSERYFITSTLAQQAYHSSDPNSLSLSLSPPFSIPLSSIILHLLLPCLIFSRVAPNFTLRNLASLWILLVWPVVILAIGLTCSFAVCFLLGMRSDMLRFGMAVCSFPNTIALPLGLIGALASQLDWLRLPGESASALLDRAYSYCLIYTTLMFLFRWTIAFSLLAPSEGTHRPHLHHRVPSSSSSSSTFSAFSASSSRSTRSSRQHRLRLLTTSDPAANDESTLRWEMDDVETTHALGAKPINTTEEEDGIKVVARGSEMNSVYPVDSVEQMDVLPGERRAALDVVQATNRKDSEMEVEVEVDDDGDDERLRAAVLTAHQDEDDTQFSDELEFADEGECVSDGEAEEENAEHTGQPPMSLKQRLLQVAMSPPIWASVIAMVVGLIVPLDALLFVLNYSGDGDSTSSSFSSSWSSSWSSAASDDALVSAPLGFVADVVSLFGSTVVPLALVMLGGRIAHGPTQSEHLNYATMLVMCMCRLLMIPAVLSGLVVLLVKSGLLGTEDRLLLLVLMLESATPTAINLIIMAVHHGAHVEELGSFMFLVYLGSVFTITGATIFFCYLIDVM